MDRICPVCHQAITDKEQRFRVREDFVHLSCSEKYMRLLSERPKGKAAPDEGG
jgi:hypothetical protein